MHRVKRSFPITADYVTEFNSINNTNFMLKHLYCTTCKETCNCDCILNPLLLDLLQGTTFLCISEKCPFKGTMSEFHKHFQHCAFGNPKCPLDKLPFKDAGNLIKHLATHKEVKKCTMDSLSLSIDLNLKNKADNIVIAEYKNNFFAVLINYDTEGNISFKVGKYLVCNAETIPTYTLIHDYGRGQIQQKADVVPLVPLLNYEEKYTSLNVKLDLIKDNPEVTIKFFDYERIQMNISECPVCLQAIVCEFTQCMNGHAFCVSCASKFTKCAICRHRMVDAVRVNLKYVLSGHHFPCKNLEEGCLALLNLDERENHGKICIYRKVKCPYCYREFRAVTICDHFRHNHDCINNFSSIRNSFYGTFLYSQFLIYRQKVFHVKTYFAEGHLRCLVELVNDDDNRAANYRYELIVKDFTHIVVGQTSNVCVKRFDSMLNQFSAAPDFSSSIYLEPFKDKLFRNGSWNIIRNYNITLCKN